MAMVVIGVILLLCLLFGFLRLSVEVWLEQSLLIRLRFLWLRLTVYPRRKKAASEKTPEEAPQSEAKPRRKRRPFIRPDRSEWADLLLTGLGALGKTARRACRRTCIDPFSLTVVIGDPDPACAAVMFGAANAAMFQWMPILEEIFDIPDPSVHLRPDFEAILPSASGRLRFSLCVCDLIVIAFTLAWPLFQWYLRYKKAHKNDRYAEQAKTEKPDTSSSIVEEKIA